MAEDTQTQEKTIPYERFQSVVGQKNELAAKVTELEGQVQSLSEKAATVDTLGQQVREWQGKAETAEARFGTYKTISSTLGTTDQEAIEAAEWAYNKLPTKDRPKLPDWLGSLKEDPSKAPKVLSPWLTQSQSQSKPADSQTPATQPRGTTNQPQAPGAPSTVSADAINAARDHAIKTGDWTRYKELRKAAGFGG